MNLSCGGCCWPFLQAIKAFSLNTHLCGHQKDKKDKTRRRKGKKKDKEKKKKSDGWNYFFLLLFPFPTPPTAISGAGKKPKRGLDLLTQITPSPAIQTARIFLTKKK